MRSPKGLNVPGGQYSAGAGAADADRAGVGLGRRALLFDANHAEGIGFLGKPLSGADPAVGETTTLVYDMSRQAVGGPDWTQSTIDQIRFDIEDKAGGGFLIRQIAIAENPDPAALGPRAAAPATVAGAGAAARRSPDRARPGGSSARGLQLGHLHLLFPAGVPARLLRLGLAGGRAAGRQRGLLRLGRGRLRLPAAGPDRAELRRLALARRHGRRGGGGWRSWRRWSSPTSPCWASSSTPSSWPTT